MSNALDAFRAQKEAIDGLRTSVSEIARLLQGVQAQVDSVVRDPGLRELLKSERQWLDQAERTIEEVRRLRQQELERFWPGVWWRWTLALVFALAAATGTGAAYGWVARPYAADVAARIDFADALAHRVLTMNPAERRQFDALMNGPAARKR
jgi:hypothetical protein